MGDTTLTAIGAGCTELHDTHIYVGTSGWVTSTVEKRMVDPSNFIASICSAIPKQYLYTAEQETSGACLQWVRDHLVQDELGIYTDSANDTREHLEDRLYDLLNEAVGSVTPGAGDLLFTPWLHGNRAPREDGFARGMFFNIGLGTGKRQMIRAVLEGVSLHKRWMLEAVERKVPRQERVRFVGGGAKSDVWAQIMADVTGRTIETVENCQNAGASGAALVTAVGLGIIPSFIEAKQSVTVTKQYVPQVQYQALYDRAFAALKELYIRNRKLFRQLNRANEPTGD